jgi:hypothetical protein
VPLADGARVVTGGPKNFCEANGIIPQMHIVHKHAIRERKLPGHQRCSMHRAHRAARDSVREIHRLSSKIIEVGRFDIGIAGVTRRCGAPLVCHQIQHIGLVHWFGGASATRDEREQHDEPFST